MSTFASLSYESAHNYVKKMQDRKKPVFWDGWDMIIHRPNPRAFMSKDGHFYDGRWGFQVRISPDSSGTWRVREYTKPARG